MALNIAALDEELEALERRSKMIQDIKRLAADPEAKALLEKIALNGSTIVPPSLSANARESMREEHSALSQIGSIRRVISKKHGQRFVVGDIGNELRTSGIDITNVAIGRVLLRLHKSGELRIALEGGGNVPNQYEATDAFSAV